MDYNIIDEIIQLRNQRMSMKVIAETLGITRDKVRYYCNKNNLGGAIVENPKVENAFEIFVSNLEKNHPNIEYVSGFVDSEKPVTIRCKECKNELIRAAQFARKTKEVKCSCLAKKSSLTKQVKSKLSITKRIILKNVVRVNPSSLIELKTNQCGECDKVFYNKRKLSICSKQCSNKRKNRLKELRERKMRMNGKIDYSITLNKLIQKEKNVCYLCGGQCDVNDHTTDNRGSFIVGKNYPSIEHVVPISKGGTHSWDNVKLAHHYCNSIKNDKQIIEETGQMVLIL